MKSIQQMRELFPLFCSWRNTKSFHGVNIIICSKICTCRYIFTYSRTWALLLPLNHYCKMYSLLALQIFTHPRCMLRVISTVGNWLCTKYESDKYPQPCSLYMHQWTCPPLVCTPIVSFLSRYGHVDSWASCQIRKIAGCACAGNAGNVFPHHWLQRNTLVSDPGMHHGTSESLDPDGGENVPGIPGACAPAIFRICQEAHGDPSHWLNQCCLQAIRDHVTIFQRILCQLQLIFSVKPIRPKLISVMILSC